MNDEKQGPSTADQVGEAAGGITGVFAGAAIGATAGPVGVLLGGIAGAIGGWWSGRAISEAAEDITSADEAYYRADFERSTDRRLRDRRVAFEGARSAYLLGDVAAANPDYTSFDDVERDLARGWSERAASQGDWDAVRDYAAVGFERGRDRRRRPR
jgi:hypothetical protein